MNCKSVEKQLIHYWEKTLSPEMMQTIDSHLLTCENCRQLVQTGKKAWLAVENSHREAVPTTFFHGIQRKLHRKNVTSPVWKSWLPDVRQFWIPASAIAAVVFGLFIGSYFGKSLILQTRVSAETVVYQPEAAGYYSFEQFNAYSDVEFLNNMYAHYQSLQTN